MLGNTFRSYQPFKEGCLFYRGNKGSQRFEKTTPKGVGKQGFSYTQWVGGSPRGETQKYQNYEDKTHSAQSFHFQEFVSKTTYKGGYLIEYYLQSHTKKTGNKCLSAWDQLYELQHTHTREYHQTLRIDMEYTSAMSLSREGKKRRVQNRMLRYIINCGGGEQREKCIQRVTAHIHTDVFGRQDGNKAY